MNMWVRLGGYEFANRCKNVHVQASQMHLMISSSKEVVKKSLPMMRATGKVHQ